MMHRDGRRRALLLTSLVLTIPLVSDAQPTSSTTTLIQDALATAGGGVGGGNPNPLKATTVLGEPAGGQATNAHVTVRIGYQAAFPPLPAGTRTIAVEGTMDDPLATIVVNGLPALITGNTFRADGLRLTEGPNVMTATATDRAGNQTSVSITVTLDTRPPARPTVGTPQAVTTQTSYTVTGTKTPGTSVWIDGRQAVSLGQETSWSAVVGLVEGDNEFRVVTRDAAGNESTSATVMAILDNLPPVVSGLAYRDAAGQTLRLDARTSAPKTNFTPVTILGQVDDSLTQVAINGVVAVRSKQQFQVAVPLIEGTNNLSLVATSPNNHVTTQTLSVLRGTPPTLTTLQPAERTKLYASAPATVTASAIDKENDPLACQILLDGSVLADWLPCAASSWTPTDAALGRHTIEVRVRDEFGGFAAKQAEVYVLRKPISPP